MLIRDLSQSLAVVGALFRLGIGGLIRSCSPRHGLLFISLTPVHDHDVGERSPGAGDDGFALCKWSPMSDEIGNHSLACLVLDRTDVQSLGASSLGAWLILMAQYFKLQ